MRVLAAASAAGAIWGLIASRATSVEVGLPRIELRVLALGLVTGGASSLLVAAPSGNVVVALAIGALAASVPVSIAAARRRAAAVRAAARWPDFLAILRGRVAAGASIPEATAAAAGQLGGRFASLEEPPRLGRPYAVVLAAVRADWADPVSDRILSTLATASLVGGSRVDAVLAALAESVADEVRLRRAHEAALTQQRLTAWVALAAPWILLILTVATNPQAAHSFSTSTGHALVAAGVLATTAGHLLARRAARLSEPPRVMA